MEEGQTESGAASAVTELGEIFLPLGELVDISKELERLNKEKANLESEIKRGYLYYIMTRLIVVINTFSSFPGLRFADFTI